jgi:hypothetical protein
LYNPPHLSGCDGFKLMIRYSFDQHDKAFVAMSCCVMGFVALNAIKVIFLAF